MEGDDESTIYSDKMLEDGHIWLIFLLFDHKSLLNGSYDVEQVDWLSIKPLVDKIFIKVLCRILSSEHDIGRYCAWSKESATASATPTSTMELSKKSNSTSFSSVGATTSGVTPP
ncbi:hypothetical protein R6Q57_021501 [Mikania cordata]